MASRRAHARRALGSSGSPSTVVAGSLAIRSADLDQFLRFLGVSPQQEETTGNIQSYAHRTVLGYIGVRIFLDHPLLGVGWQGSAEESRTAVPRRARRFPSPPRFPSAAHPWGVQNAYIQALADLGVLGLALLLAVFGVGDLARRPKRERRADRSDVAPRIWPGVWNGVGLVAGVPAEALTWLACGLAAFRE